MGRTAAGVTGMRLKEDDSVISAIVVSSENPILIVTENGYGKRTPLEEYRLQNRGGKGIYTIKVTERNGCVVDIMQNFPAQFLLHRHQK